MLVKSKDIMRLLTLIKYDNDKPGHPEAYFNRLVTPNSDNITKPIENRLSKMLSKNL